MMGLETVEGTSVSLRMQTHVSPVGPDQAEGANTPPEIPTGCVSEGKHEIISSGLIDHFSCNVELQ